jgi:hypothetical protein
MNKKNATTWCGLIPTIKDWIDLTPITGTYLVKNISFTLDGKPINDCLHATQFSWKQLLEEAVDPVSFDNENDCLLAYYRMQAFLYYECNFEIERVYHHPDPTLANHLIEINNLIENEQPYNYSFDLGLNYQTTDELVEFLYPETWFAVIPAAYEFAMTYVDKQVSDMLLKQAVFEYLINTLPVNIFSKAHCLSKTPLTNPNLLDDLIGFDIPTDTKEKFKRFIVNNAFSLPIEFKYRQYKDIH